MPYRLHPRAALDLDDIYAHGVEAFGISAADRYFLGLLDVFDLLERFPASGVEFRPGNRRFGHRPYIIIYSADSDRGVTIERVVSGRSNWREHLG